MSHKLNEELKKVFRPEFINRLDGVIIFRMLNKNDIREIVNIELEKVAARLKDNNISLHASEAARDQFTEQGFNPEMGARPLRRVIQNQVEDKLSDALLAHEFKDGDHILIDLNADKDVVLKLDEETQSGENRETPTHEIAMGMGI